jgi:hypothetical protein
VVILLFNNTLATYFYSLNLKCKKHLNLIFNYSYYVVGSNPKSHISKKKRHKASLFFGRDYRIRTYDILLPKQALYQAELSPVNLCNRKIIFKGRKLSTTSFLLRKARFIKTRQLRFGQINGKFALFAVACSLINRFYIEIKKTFHRKLF